MLTYRKQANGWTIRKGGEEVRDDDGRILRYARKCDAQSAARLLFKPKRKRKAKK